MGGRSEDTIIPSAAFAWQSMSTFVRFSLTHRSLAFAVARAAFAASCCHAAPLPCFFRRCSFHPKSADQASRVNPCHRNPTPPMPWIMAFCLAPALGVQKRGRAVWSGWLLSALHKWGWESFSWNFCCCILRCALLSTGLRRL